MTLGCLLPLLTAPEAVSVGSREMQRAVDGGISDYTPKANSAHLSELLHTPKSQFLLLLIAKLYMIFFAVPKLWVLLNTCHYRENIKLKASILIKCFESILKILLQSMH